MRLRVRSDLQVPEEENMQWVKGSLQEGPNKKDSQCPQESPIHPQVH